MQYYYQKLFYDHWVTIIPMINYHYATPEYENSYLVLGQYVNQSTEEIRKDIKLSLKKEFDKLIIYQLEPLVENHWHKTDYIIKQLKGADEVWDYDLQNIEILHSYGIDAKFRPILYTPSLEVIKNKEDPDIDVLFVGTFTDHREKFFRDITRYIVLNTNELDFFDINFVWANNILGDKLNKLVANSKVCLNLQLYSGENRQQQTRIAYLLNNNKYVLTEKTEMNYFGESAIGFTDITDFKNKILDIFRNDLWKNPPVDYFKKSRSKIAVFYHLDQSDPNWINNYNSHFSKLQNFGIYNRADYIHLDVSGSADLPLHFYRIYRFNQNVDLQEHHTLSSLWHFAKANPDYKILYINSKINQNNNLSTEEALSFQNYMEYFPLEKQDVCLKLLNTFDCVGAEWFMDPDYNLPSYQGNIWWATGSYISRLELSMLSNELKHFSRLWVGMAEPKYFCFKEHNMKPE